MAPRFSLRRSPPTRVSIISLGRLKRKFHRRVTEDAEKSIRISFGLLCVLCDSAVNILL